MGPSSTAAGGQCTRPSSSQPEPSVLHEDGRCVTWHSPDVEVCYCGYLHSIEWAGALRGFGSSGVSADITSWVLPSLVNARGGEHNALSWSCSNCETHMWRWGDYPTPRSNGPTLRKLSAHVAGSGCLGKVPEAPGVSWERVALLLRCFPIWDREGLAAGLCSQVLCKHLGASQELCGSPGARSQFPPLQIRAKAAESMKKTEARSKVPACSAMGMLHTASAPHVCRS